MLTPELAELALSIAARLKDRGETIAVAESAAGGLISATLVAVPGASAYYRGGFVIYTLDGAKQVLSGGPTLPPDARGATEPFARWLALSAATNLMAPWGIGETGAAGPAGNPYGDPSGRAWVAMSCPDGQTCARLVETGSDDRAANMRAFVGAALKLALETLT